MASWSPGHHHHHLKLSLTHTRLHRLSLYHSLQTHLYAKGQGLKWSNIIWRWLLQVFMNTSRLRSMIITFFLFFLLFRPQLLCCYCLITGALAPDPKAHFVLKELFLFRLNLTRLCCFHILVWSPFFAWQTKSECLLWKRQFLLLSRFSQHYANDSCFNYVVVLRFFFCFCLFNYWDQQVCHRIVLTPQSP